MRELMEREKATNLDRGVISEVKARRMLPPIPMVMFFLFKWRKEKGEQEETLPDVWRIDKDLAGYSIVFTVRVDAADVTQ